MPVDTPVAPAPVAAPAASAPAPVATPVTPVAAPAAAEPVAAPVAAPAVPDGTAPEPVAPAADASMRPVKPVQADFGEEGGKFLTAHAKWEAEEAAWLEAHPDGEVAPAAVEPPAATAEVTTEPGDIDLTKLPGDEAAVTPQGLQEMLTGDAALAAAIEANPAAKGKLFQMARRNAELEPLGQVFPGGVKSAEFAQKTAGEYVGLRSKFESAVIDPGKIVDAFDAFVGQFAIVDAEGKPVLDASGKPKLAEDFNLLAGHMSKLDYEGRLAEVNARLEANAYKTPEARERDEQKKFALEFIQPDDSFEDKPDYSHLPEADRKAMEAREADLKVREEALATKTGGVQTAEHKAAVEKGEKDFLGEHGKYLSTSLKSTVDELRNAGAHIPQWMLEYKAPGETMSTFSKNVIDGLVKVVNSDPYLAAQSTKLQRAHAKNPTPENLTARLDFFNGIAKDNIRTLVMNELKSAVKKSTPAAAPKPGEEPNPSSEPRGGGGAVAPKVLTQEAAMATAREQLAKEIPNWESLEPSQRNSYALTRMSRLMSQAR